MKSKLVWIGGLVMALSIFSWFNQAETPKQKFHNTETQYETHFGVFWEIIKSYVTTKRAAPVPPSTLPIKPLTFEEIRAVRDNSAVKLGHSSVLMKVNEQVILLDPVFSERVSPVQWAGPKRFHQPPIKLADIEQVDVVVISHDHYDHLDKGAIKQLKEKVGQFVVPLRVGDYLREWGVAAEKITELEWWQKTQVNGVEYIATPTQHFSGRGLMDRDLTLWASWVIRTSDINVYFSGDSGYFSGFAEIGEKYGPFDLTFVETGAYNKLWSEIHMLPEESLQAHIDLKGKVMMPIHNATFDLALHDWDEPLERVTQLSESNQVTIATPIFGEFFDLANPQANNRWWREL
ncbi:MBL fold metallo-hydrolase [Thalassotalea euphylliae]|nr:MBL fold metallo-hydrolase [Thalassotalea euphylliae]